jgi:cation transporter-like permease
MGLGGELRVSVAVAGNTVTVTDPVVVAAGLLESVASTVTVFDPAVVGIPLTTQLADKVRPAGNVPAARVQVYGAFPPVTPIVPV